MTLLRMKSILLLCAIGCLALQSPAVEPRIAVMKPDSADFKTIMARFIPSEGLWQVNTNGFCPGDTLRVGNVIPHPGTLFQAGCCGTTEGWYDTLTGLHLIVPQENTDKESLRILFAGDAAARSKTPAFQTSGFEITGSWRFSRTAEIRLKGENLYYSFNTSGELLKWKRYLRPLLINQSGLLKAVNVAPGSLTSEQVTLKLIRINDIERVTSSPEPCMATSPDELLKLFDGDTASHLSWCANEVLLELNPGVGRSATGVTLWLGTPEENGFPIPGRITIESSDDNQGWLQLANVKSGHLKKNSLKIVIDFEGIKSFRYIRIKAKATKPKLTLAEIKIHFVP